MMGNHAEIGNGMRVDAEIDVYSIAKGHMRTAVAKCANGKHVFLLCVTDKYCEPGTIDNDNGNGKPLVGLEIWGAKQLRILAQCCLEAAEYVEKHEGETEHEQGNEE
jgi:hypothetical protein